MNATQIDTIRLKWQERKILSLAPQFGDGINFMKLKNALARYYEGGKGSETLVFIPDAPNTIEHYNSLIPLLIPHYRVVVLELPGFGFSIPTNTSFCFSLQDATDFVLEFLDKLGHKNYRLCFSCVSGFIAVKAARLRPDIISKIVIMQTPEWQEEKQWAKRIDFKGLIATPFIGQLLMLLKKQWVAKQWYHHALPQDNYQSSYFETSREAFAKGSNYSLASAFQSLFGMNDPTFKKVKQPTVIIWGMKDRTHKKTNKESVSAYFENAEIIQFENAGHFPELEQPLLFYNIISKT